MNFTQPLCWYRPPDLYPPSRQTTSKDKQDRHMPNILDEHPRPSAPFISTGGATGVLLVHGFLGSPQELQPLAERLAQEGHTVRAILLPGHGENPERLKGIPWQRWAEHVQSELDILKQTAQRVVVVGFSMGGLLALMMAAQGRCDAVVAMAPALHLRMQKQMRFAGIIKYVMPWMYPFKKADFNAAETQANIRQYIPDADFSDVQLTNRLRAEVRIPLSAVGQLVAVQRAVKPMLSDLCVPLLVVQGQQDQTVNPISGSTVFEGVGTQQKEIAWFANSGHMLMQETDRDEICQTVSTWIDKTLR